MGSCSSGFVWVDDGFGVRGQGLLTCCMSSCSCLCIQMLHNTLQLLMYLSVCVWHDSMSEYTMCLLLILEPRYS